MQCLVNTYDESELSSQVVTVFWLVFFFFPKLQQFLPGERKMWSCSILMEDYASSECLSSAAFSWSNWEQYLLELIIWFSKRSS